MPIYVEWKWEEQTQSLLAIFHFYDDFSKPNLRLFKKDDERIAVYYSPKGDRYTTKKTWVTWAPSHSELGLLMELLSYANIINGLKPTEKKKLWTKLIHKNMWTADRKKFGPMYNKYDYDEHLDIVYRKTASPLDAKKKMGMGKKVLFYQIGENQPLRSCAELCPEYIDYLKKVLKPYTT